MIDDGILLNTSPKAKGLGDLGYQGVTSDCPWLTVITPLKRKPKQKLSSVNKLTNKTISSLRVRVEHTIAKLKVYKILKDTFRNNLQLADLVFKNICCLYNFKLSYRYAKVKT